MELEQKDLSQLLETATVAARLAGQHAMEQMSYVKALVKNEEELVTQADAQCQKIIVDRIKETYPDHGFIAEEGERNKIFKQPPRAKDSIWWLIDPIDGTNNFAHQLPLFAVSVAAMYQGEPVVGVVFDPATESMFTAVKGREAQLNGRRITVSDDTISEYTSIGLDSHFPSPIPNWAAEIMRRTRFRNLGTTALELAYVAKGSLVASIFCSPKLWDIAAGALIAEVSGAIVTDWKGGKILPVDLESYDGARFQTLAANKKTHAELLKMLK